MKRWRLVSAAALTVLVFAGQPALAGDMEKADILTTAARAGEFKTLVSAVVATGLDKSLKGQGHFTVFAPTDAAFQHLPKEVLEGLLKPENKDQLAAILKYHVVPRVINVPKHPPAHRLKKTATLAGPEIRFTRNGTKVKVNNSNIVVRDIECTNGVIQVIDAVLIPPTEAKNTIPAVAEKAGEFKTLLAALKTADLAEVLEGEGPFTVFAPTDAAFAKLPKGTVETLLKPENKDKLQAILKYHVVAGKVLARDAVTAGKAKTLQGGTVTARIVNGRLTINESGVTASDVAADNGVIHIIDQVLLPK